MSGRGDFRQIPVGFNSDGIIAVASNGHPGVGLRIGLAAVGSAGLVVIGASFGHPWVEKGDENGTNLLALVDQPVSLVLMMMAIGLWITWLVGLVRNPWWSPGVGLAGSVLAMVTLALTWAYVDIYTDGSAEVRMGAHVALVGVVLLTATTAFHTAACTRHRPGRPFASTPRSDLGPRVSSLPDMLAVAARVASLLGMVAVAAAFALDWASLRNADDELYHTVAPGHGGLLFHLVVVAVVLATVMSVLWLALPSRRWARAVGLAGSVLGLTAVAALWGGIAAGDAGRFDNVDRMKGAYGAYVLWYGWCWVLACVAADAVADRALEWSADRGRTRIGGPPPGAPPISGIPP